MILWSRDQCNVTRQFEKSISPLLQYLWPLNLPECWLQRGASASNRLSRHRLIYGSDPQFENYCFHYLYAPGELITYVKIPEFWHNTISEKKNRGRGRGKRKERQSKWMKNFDGESRYMKFRSQVVAFIRFWCLHRSILLQARFLKILNVLLN